MNHKSSLKALAITCFTFIILLNTNSRAAGISPSTLNAPDPLGIVQSGEPCKAQPETLTDGKNQYPLGKHVDLLRDPNGKLTIDQVTSPAFRDQFTPSLVDVPSFGYTSDVYWVRLCLDNHTQQKTQWLLDTGFPNMHYVDLYTPRPDGTGFDARQTGVLRPLYTRDLLVSRFVFALDVPAGATEALYLRFQNGESMTLPLTLWQPGAFSQTYATELLLFGLFYGALFIMLIYHLFVLYSLREASYLYYVFFLATGILTFACYDALAALYLWPNQYLLNRYGMPVFVFLFLASILKFTDTFLDIKERIPGLHRVILVLMAACGLLLVLVPFVSYHLLAYLYAPLALISAGVAGAAGLISWRDGYQPARFFLFSWVGFLFGVIMIVLVREGYVRSTNLSEIPLRAGILWLAAFWSISLADRINLLKSETERANRALLGSEHKLEQILEGLPLGVVMYGKDRKPNYINRRSVEILNNPEQGIMPDLSAGRTPEMAIKYYSLKKEATDRTYPLKEFPIHSALEGESASADDIVADMGDRRIPLEVWASPVRDNQGNVESAVVAFQDITERKEAEAELTRYRKELESLVEKRTRELTAINAWLDQMNEIHQMVSGARDLPGAYRKLSLLLLQLLNAQIVFIIHLDQQFEHFEVRSASRQEFTGLNEFAQKWKAVFHQNSSLYQEITAGKTVVAAAAREDPLTGLFKDCFPDLDIQSFVLAPMITHQKIGGLVGMALPQPVQEIPSQQVIRIEKMSLDIANLSENALLLDQALDLAMVEERNRLARELHDSVSQVLYSASLMAELLPQRFKRSPEAALETASELRRLTRGALAEMRTLLLELRPSGITKMPLGELLAQLIESVTSRTELSFELNVENIPPLPPEIQIAFYRIAQESINNVVKHAQASKITLSLSAIPSIAARTIAGWTGEIAMRITDDGFGFRPEDPFIENLGLGIMRERAAAIEAIYDLKSQPGEGTEVTLVWHCPEVN